MQSPAQRALVAFTTASAILLLPSTSHADNPVSPDVEVFIESWLGRVAKVCAIGGVDDGAPQPVQWVFAITGARGDGGLIAPAPVPGTGLSFGKVCRDVNASSQHGAFTATLTAVGVGTSDLIGNAGLVYTWNGLTADIGTSYSSSSD